MRQNHQRRATGRSRTGAPRAAFVTAVAIAAVAATTALVLFGAGTAGAHTDLVQPRRLHANATQQRGVTHSAGAADQGWCVRGRRASWEPS